MVKKLSLYVVLSLLWCNNVMGGIDIFADNKRLDYNFICTSPDKAIKNDWSNIWNKFGFIRFGSGINKVLLYSSWDTKGKIYNFHSALVEKNELNEEDYEFSYIWHGIYFPITYKSGEKGPIIHTNILSKLKRHDQYYRAEKYIKISKEKYETLERFKDEALQQTNKKNYISAMQRNRKIIENLASKSYSEGNLDKEFGTACKLE